MIAQQLRAVLLDAAGRIKNVYQRARFIEMIDSDPIEIVRQALEALPPAKARKRKGGR